MKNLYKNAMEEVKASEELKRQTIQKMIECRDNQSASSVGKAKSSETVNRKPLKIAIIAASAAVVLFCAIFFPIMLLGGGTVPVYQGMTVSGANASRALNTPVQLSETDGELDGGEIEKNTPTIDVIGGSGDIDYYASPNEKLIITINIYNPSYYEILSFTLNGTKYQSYQFLPGSDSEKLLLEVTLDSVRGIKQYTIDAIKYVDGRDINDVRMDGKTTVKIAVAQIAPTASIGTYTIGNSTAQFNITVIDTEGIVESDSLVAVLYQKDEQIEQRNVSIGANTLEFDKLSTYAQYTLKVFADYDLLTGTGLVKAALLNIDFRTKGIYSLTDVQSAQESLSFDVEETNDDSVTAQITAIELYKGTEKVRTAANINVREFIGLLSNTEYTIKLTYTYDLNDGKGNRELIITESVRTKAKRTPEIEIIDLDSQTDSISFDIDVTDTDSVGALTKIELFKGEEKALTAANTNVREFIGLLSNTEYTIKLTYTYDLNDGAGGQVLEVSKKYYTMPEFNVSNVRVANTSAVAVGGVLAVRVTVSNPDGLAVTSVKINGKNYNANAMSTATLLIVEITVDENFGGGQTDITVEQISGQIRGETYTYDFVQNNTSSVFINGELYVLSVKFTDGQHNPIVIAEIGQRTFVEVELQNSTGYNIDKLVTSYGEFLPQDITAENANCRLVIDVTSAVTDSNGVKTLEVKGISYSNASLAKNKNIVNTYATLCVLDSMNVISIRTAADLKNIDGQSYKKYRLENDIDLSGTEWSGGDFYGYFDGNGYSIKNMSVVNDFENVTLYFGLFNNASGYIKDLRVEDILYIVTLTSSNSSQIYFGGIAAVASNLTLENCIVGGDVSFTVDKIDVYTYSSVGGLMGKAVSASVNSCTNNINISAPKTYAGGIAGFSDGGNLTISASKNTGSISGETVGGLIGSCSSANQITITSSYNTGTVSCDEGNFSQAGGLIGNCSSANQITITSSYNTGTVSCVEGNFSQAGGLIGNCSSANQITITSSYNTGAVSGKGADAGAGGLIGRSQGAITIDLSYNTGEINGSFAAGGLVGEGNQVTITLCYNTAAVCSDNSYAGGLVGRGSQVTITLCYNTAAVYGGTGAGGLVGEGNLTVTLSYNSGAVKGNEAGGMVGRLSSRINITLCYNTAAVYGGTGAGGLVGTGYSVTNFSVKSSYSSGAVDGIFTPGALLGYLADTDLGVLEFENCRYYSDNGNVKAVSILDAVVIGYMPEGCTPYAQVELMYEIDDLLNQGLATPAFINAQDRPPQLIWETN